MSDIDLVTKEYLQDLTDRKRKKLVMQWFYERGYKPERGFDGYPKVTQGLIKKILDGDTYQAPIKRKRGNRQALKETMGI